MRTKHLSLKKQGFSFLNPCPDQPMQPILMIISKQSAFSVIGFFTSQISILSTPFSYSAKQSFVLPCCGYIVSPKSLTYHIISCYKKITQNDRFTSIIFQSSLESPILLCYTTTIKPERRYPSCKISFLESLSASAGWILG